MNSFTFICKIYNLKITEATNAHTRKETLRILQFADINALLETLKPNPELLGSFMHKLFKFTSSIPNRN